MRSEWSNQRERERLLSASSKDRGLGDQEEEKLGEKINVEGS